MAEGTGNSSSVIPQLTGTSEGKWRCTRTLPAPTELQTCFPRCFNPKASGFEAHHPPSSGVFGSPHPLPFFLSLLQAGVTQALQKGSSIFPKQIDWPCLLV